MLTTKFKAGLVLAILLGLSDVSIVFAAGSDDGPPAVIVVISVVIGLITILAAVAYWRKPTWALLLTVFVTRVISALGDIPGFFQGVTFLVLTLILFVVSLVCLWLLWPSVRRRTA